jgi:hypothetical protein
VVAVAVAHLVNSQQIHLALVEQVAVALETQTLLVLLEV